MEHFPHQTAKGTMMIESTKPRRVDHPVGTSRREENMTRTVNTRYTLLRRLVASACLAGAAAFGSTALSATAYASQDLEDYKQCVAEHGTDDVSAETCCILHNGQWVKSKFDNFHYCSLTNELQQATPTEGRQPIVQLPPDLVNAPVVTKEPPRPIHVPSDIATVSTVSQAPA
jgi:hypothetical protein